MTISSDWATATTAVDTAIVALAAAVATESRPIMQGQTTVILRKSRELAAELRTLVAQLV